MTSICCYLLSCVGSHNRLSNKHMAITKFPKRQIDLWCVSCNCCQVKEKKNLPFFGIDAIKNPNPAAVTKWRLHLLLWRNGTCSVDHVEVMHILLSPFLLSFLLSMFSFTAIASLALLEVWPTCNNFLRDLHNPNRLLKDWKLWSSAQFLLDHADFPLPRKSQSNPTTLKHILCILLHILQNRCYERPCVEAKQQTGSLGSWSWPCQIVNFAMLYKLEVHWCYMLVSFSATFLMKKLWFFRVPEKNWIPKNVMKHSWNSETLESPLIINT